MTGPSPHLSVLYQEVLTALDPRPAGRYVDGTLGAGGHAAGILAASAPDGLLLGLDVDPQALQIARQRLAPYGERAILRHTSYTNLADEVARLGWSAVDGVVLDLGASSMQFDTADRGFSFRQDAPLDMRFDTTQATTAADLVNHLPEDELADLIYTLGEERNSRRIARRIVAARPLHTTAQLADVVASATGSGKPGMHPATRTFQALRMAVNQELDNIAQVLPQIISVLRPGGRLAIIAFHSLEDRLVKQFIQQETRDCICPPRQPVCTCGHKASLRKLSSKAIKPGDEEMHNNPRARSARLRTAERIDPGNA